MMTTRNAHTSAARVIIASLFFIFLSSCAHRPAVLLQADLPPECIVVVPPADCADTVRVAIFEPPRPEHAPAARNAGERFMFHHLYENLITIDCLGEVRPGLAGSWRSAKGGRRWTFELREGARFWDDSPVTPRDVIESWRYTALDPMTRGSGIDSVIAGDDSSVHVYFARRRRQVPRELSAPEYAVAKGTWESRWPLGTGGYRIAASDESFRWTPGRTFRLLPAFSRGVPVIECIETVVDDARDLLEDGIDCLITADPVVIEYAAGLRQFETVALPYGRTYVLLAPTRVHELRQGNSPATIPLDYLDRMARDAVRGDARGPRPPYWWDDPDRCGGPPGGTYRRPAITLGLFTRARERRIMYEAGDRVARELAERIVALASTGHAVSSEEGAIIASLPRLDDGVSGPTSEGAAGEEFATSLRDGYDFAYIIAVPRRPHDPCEEVRRLIHRVRWLAADGIDLSESIIPLAETRSYCIVRKGAVGCVVDWFGDVLMMNDAAEGD